MKKLLEAINRGILTALNESNINLLSDLDDDTLDQMDSLYTKNINSKRLALCPKTREELATIIKSVVERKGWECSLNHIDVSKITDMSDLFSIDDACFGLGKFNGDISEWNVTNVKYMTAMFCGSHFNGDISNWIITIVVDMYGMFFNSKFENNLSNWEINSSCNTDEMFDNCPIKEEYKPKVFNNTKKLLEAANRGILRGLHEQNIELLSDLDDDNLGQPDSLQTKNINNLDDTLSLYKNIFIRAVKNRTMIPDSIKNAINNPDNFQRYKGIIKATNEEHLKELINTGRILVGDDGNYNWIDTSELHTLNCVFINNKWFNGYIDLWDTSSVITMDGLFWHAESFNRPIGNWDVRNVTKMKQMFYHTNNFNQDISNWQILSCEKPDLFDTFHNICDNYKPIC